jgi:hypothetical protein
LLLGVFIILFRFLLLIGVFIILFRFLLFIGVFIILFRFLLLIGVFITLVRFRPRVFVVRVLFVVIVRVRVTTLMTKQERLVAVTKRVAGLDCLRVPSLVNVGGALFSVHNEFLSVWSRHSILS